jgi:NAD(P)-dependent dehydrogenase (short-subunit alcohol dehydrogenase family)
MEEIMRGKTLITGAADGLGVELVMTLAKQKYPLVIHYNTSHESAKRLARECKEHGVEADIIQGDFSTLKSTLDFIRRYQTQFPETENIIYNVGNYLIKSALATEIEEWHELYQTNFFAPISLINALVESVKKHKGSIINIGVVGVNDVPADVYSTAYTSTKLTLWMLTKSLAKELAKDQVRVNMISPGHMENSIDLPKNLSTLPMGRAATLKEVANTVAFLLDKENSYITGQNIEIAGGVRL